MYRHQMTIDQRIDHIHKLEKCGIEGKESFVEDSQSHIENLNLNFIINPSWIERIKFTRQINKFKIYFRTEAYTMRWEKKTSLVEIKADTKDDSFIGIECVCCPEAFKDWSYTIGSLYVTNKVTKRRYLIHFDFDARQLI